MTSLKVVIAEKLNNFINFLHSLAGDNEHVKTILAQHKSITPELFIHHIKTSIIPNKENIDMIMLNYCKAWNIDLKNITKEDKRKIERYLEMFCDLCS